MRRRDLLGLAVAGVALSAYAATGAPARRIELTARKFAFTPAEITVKRGQPVTLAVTSVDFVHGFAMPDFGVRRDLFPGKVVEVAITPDKAGRFHFLCDNFCGEDHDRMSGILVVAG
jgi:cytochrome c oxidase subunit 2